MQERSVAELATTASAYKTAQLTLTATDSTADAVRGTSRNDSTASRDPHTGRRSSKRRQEPVARDGWLPRPLSPSGVPCESSSEEGGSPSAHGTATEESKYESGANTRSTKASGRQTSISEVARANAEAARKTSRQSSRNGHDEESGGAGKGPHRQVPALGTSAPNEVKATDASDGVEVEGKRRSVAELLWRTSKTVNKDPKTNKSLVEEYVTAKRPARVCRHPRILLLAFLAVPVFILATVIALVNRGWAPDPPEIDVQFGAVRGKRLVVSDQGREWPVLAFLGVPFAKAPIGTLRFQRPLPMDNPFRRGNKVTTLDSVVKRPPCPQQDYYLGHDSVNTSAASEDCLHLNIWTPPPNCRSDQEPGSCGLRTVFFFLYGASFQNGGNNLELYDGRYLSALGNLVVVVPNYRVGPLGFLGVRSSQKVPGNAGLYDQQMALEWTRDNIDYFGGNASHLVLAGHDSGAASLGYHLFSGDTAFWTRNVTRFILQSGGPFHSYDDYGEEGARQLASSLRCPPDLVSEASVRCLQRADVNAVARSPLAPSFVPMFSTAPLSRPQPRQAQERQPQAKDVQGCQFLLGRVEREGAYPWFVEQRRTGARDPQQLVALLLGQSNILRWQNATGIILNPASGHRPYQQAVGDILEVCPMHEFAVQLNAWHNQVYAYVLGYRPSYSSWLNETEAVHFEDMELVFGVPLRPQTPSSEPDKEWARTMIQVWSTFAHTGKAPAVLDTKWTEYDSHRRTVMKLGPRGVTEQIRGKQTHCDLLRESKAPY